jgi:hypothetical protein
VNQTSPDLAARRNAPTLAVTSSRGSREALGPRASFLLAYDRLLLLAGASTERSVVVAAVDVSGDVVASRRILSKSAVVVGRHDQCGLRLPGHTVALRHVVALVQLDGDRTLTHLRDLATRQPFLTEDRRPSSSLTADGPLYIALGEYALWLVPSQVLVVHGAPRGAEETWANLAPRGFVEHRPPVDAPRPARLGVLASLRQTCITRLAPPLLLDDGDAQELAWGELRLEAGGRKEKRWVSAERLDHGILLGRYTRCGLLLDPNEATTSRVHALLLRLGSDVWVIDLASTNGVKRGGLPVSAEILNDRDTISLGNNVTVGWKRLRHPEA